MEAVAALWSGQRRRQWRGWLALALILAIGAGSGMACLAGARRTASAFDRYAADGRIPDVNTGHSETLEDAEATIAGFDGVDSHASVVGFAGSVDGLDPSLMKYFIATWDKPVPWIGADLEAGRLPDPDRVDEVLAIGKGVETAGLRPGDEITVELFSTDFSHSVPKTVVVVGTGDDPLAAVSDATYDRSAIFFTPAFARANAAELQVWSATEFVATSEPGAEARLISQLNEIGWSVDETRPVIQGRVQDAIRPLVTVLALLGVLVLATTVLVVRQALARQTAAAAEERHIARAMGFTRGQLRGLDALAVLSVALPGAILGVLVALAASRLFPAGAVRQLDPAEGAFADLTVLSVGSVGVVVILVLLGALGRGRVRSADRSAARPLFAGLSALRPSVTPGLRLAVGGTVPQRRQFWTTVARSAAGLSLLVGGIAFVAALDRLAEDPVRFGASWELTTRNAFGDVPPDDVRALTADDPDIVGLTGGSLDSVVVNDSLNVPLMAFQPITAALWPTVIDGTVPREANEVLVGVDVLDEIDADIGDEIRIGSPYRPDAPPTVATIVGTAVFPSIEKAGVNPARLGHGVAIDWQGYQALLAAGRFEDDEPDFVFFDLADGADPQSVIDRYPEGMPELTGFSSTEWLTSLTPAEVLETDRATGLIWSVIALLGLTVLASLGHTLAGSVRQHRRDYAILKAIGFTRRQVLSSVSWQSTLPIVLALLLALPIGTALGRWWWRLLARLIGVIDTPVVPVTGLIVVTAGALVASGLVAVVPGLRSARLPAAAGLKDE
jgi:hypothetical protein